VRRILAVVRRFAVPSRRNFRFHSSTETHYLRSRSSDSSPSQHRLRHSCLSRRRESCVETDRHSPTNSRSSWTTVTRYRSQPRLRLLTTALGHRSTTKRSHPPPLPAFARVRHRWHAYKRVSENAALVKTSLQSERK